MKFDTVDSSKRPQTRDASSFLKRVNYLKTDMITSGGKSFVSTSAKTAILNSNEQRRATYTEPTLVIQDRDDS